MHQLDRFLAKIKAAASLSNTLEILVSLYSLLSVSLYRNPAIQELNLVCQDIDVTDTQILAMNLFDNDWNAFNDLLRVFLRLANQLNPWLVLESYDLYADYMSSLAIAFSNSTRGHLLTPLLRETASILLPMLVRLDLLAYLNEAGACPRLAHLAAVLLRVFNNIRSQLAAYADRGAEMKRTIILYIGNQLCLVYFRLGNPLLCRNIFSNMGNAQLKMAQYNTFEQAQYRFFLARFYLIKDQIVNCHVHLLWCLQHLPLEQSPANSERLLKYLIPVSIALGKLPNIAGFSRILNASCPLGESALQMLEMYESIAAAIGAGNFSKFNLVVSTYYITLKQQGLLLLIIQKCKLVLLRNLVKKIHNANGGGTILDYVTFKAGLILLMGSDLPTRQKLLILPTIGHADEIDDLFMENVFVTLIDQSLIRAKLFTLLRKAAFSKTDAFPKIDSIYFERFGGTTDSWLES